MPDSSNPKIPSTQTNPEFTTRYLEILNSMSSLSTAENDEISFEIELIEKLRIAIECDCVSYWELDSVNQIAVLGAYSIKNLAANIDKYSIKFNEKSPFHQCTLKNKSAIVSNIKIPKEDPRATHIKRVHEGIYLPLVVDTSFFGCLELLFTSNDFFNESDQKFFDFLASHISSNLTMRSIKKQVGKQVDRHEQLIRISEKIHQSPDVESLFETTLKEICLALNLPGATIKIDKLDLLKFPEKKQDILS